MVSSVAVLPPVYRPSELPLLDGFAPSASTEREEEITQLMTEILSGTGPLIIEAADLHIEELKGFLELLLRTATGWSLIQAIQAQGHPITIAALASDTSADASCYNLGERKVYLSLTPCGYELVKNADEMICIVRIGSTLDRVGALGHELFHALLQLQGRSVLFEPPVIDPDFHNLEEEVVIETGEFAENKLRAELRLGARVIHWGSLKVSRVLVKGFKKGFPLSQLLHSPGIVWRKEDLKEVLLVAVNKERQDEVGLILETATGTWTAQDLIEVLERPLARGNESMVHQLLAATSVSWTPANLRFLLYAAVNRGREAIVRHFLDSAEGQWTPYDLLHVVYLAIDRGNEAIVRQLDDAAEGQWTPADLQTALKEAVRRRDEAMVCLLLAVTGGSFPLANLQEVLETAYMYDDEPIVRQLLASIERPLPFAELKIALRNAVGFARDVAVVSLLLAEAPGQWTPANLTEALKEAVRSRNTDTVRLIIKAAAGQWTPADIGVVRAQIVESISAEIELELDNAVTLYQSFISWLTRGFSEFSAELGLVSD